MDALTGASDGLSIPFSSESTNLTRGSKGLLVVQIGETLQVTGNDGRSIATLQGPAPFCSLGKLSTSEGDRLYAAHTGGIRLWSHDFSQLWDLQTFMPWGRSLELKGDTLVASGHCRTEWHLRKGSWEQVSEEFTDLL